MIGGVSRVTQDVPPYSLSVGVPALIYGINTVGIKRAGLSLKTLKLIKQAYRLLVFSGLSRTTALERIEKEVEMTPEIQNILTFVRASERGLIGAATAPSDDAE
jgi:UDP-N-acetylglucosamine acyltransferase